MTPSDDARELDEIRTRHERDDLGSRSVARGDRGWLLDQLTEARAALAERDATIVVLEKLHKAANVMIEQQDETIQRLKALEAELTDWKGQA